LNAEKELSTTTMERAWKISLTNHGARLLMITALLIAISGAAYSSLGPVAAQVAFDFSISLNGYSLSVSPNHSGYVQVTVSLSSGTSRNVTLSSVVSPQDGLLSTSFAQSSGYPSFVTTLIVNALNATPGAQYTVTVAGASLGLTKQAPPLTVTIGCPQGSCATLTTAGVGDGTTHPSCSSGCSEPIGQVLSVTAVPDPNWAFSGWNVTGASCSGGLDSNPCSFIMPNSPVTVTANFVQYQQTLFTSYAGDGEISPACPSGCQVPIGSTVSVVATPASGWTVSGYRLTSGVTCGSQTGFVCSFTMPSFPVTFQVVFSESTETARSIVTVSSTILASITTTTVVQTTATSTITTPTLSITQTGSTLTSTVYSTSNTLALQTQSFVVTQFWTSTISETSVTTTLENPGLELALAAIILLSAVMIGISAIRRSPRGGSIVCARCGTKNSLGVKFCVNCGEPLKGSRTK